MPTNVRVIWEMFTFNLYLMLLLPVMCDLLKSMSYNTSLLRCVSNSNSALACTHICKLICTCMWFVVLINRTWTKLSLKIFIRICQNCTLKLNMWMPLNVKTHRRCGNFSRNSQGSELLVEHQECVS